MKHKTAIVRMCRCKSAFHGVAKIKRKSLRGAILLCAIAAAVYSVPAAGQSKIKSPSDIPRTSDGKPDISGVWQVLNTAAWDILPHNASAGIPAGLGVVEGDQIPYLPEALQKKKENFANRLTDDTDAKCYRPGVPRITYMPYPFEIFQNPKYVTFVYEYIHLTRLVYTNGSSHPKDIDFWMGDSRGHWEGDTLVVDSTDFNDQTWFDKVGDFHSDALHVIERYNFIDKDHLDYEVTIEDPKTFTKSWKMKMPLYRRIEKDIRPLEYDCNAFDHLFHIPEQANGTGGGR